jgi:hypothetical protein
VSDQSSSKKPKDGGIASTIAVVVMLGVAAVAIVVNVRNCAAKQDRMQNGWNVASYLAEATSDAVRWHSDAELVELTADYTDAQGNAHLENGDSTFSFTFQSLAAAASNTGAGGQLGAAPSKKRTYCQLNEYIHNRRPQLSDGLRDGACTDRQPIRHCDVVQIWQRAIAQGAPKDALADIDYDATGWRFKITDRSVMPNKTIIKLRLPDDCTPTVEGGSAGSAVSGGSAQPK